MILTDKIKIKISKKNIEHFKNLGMNVNLKDEITINPEQLNKGNYIKIKVRCDICGNEKELMFKKYLKNIKNGGFYACSSKCSQKKVKDTSLDKFGKEHYSKTKEYNDSVKHSSIEKFGCLHSSQNEQVKNKLKKTNLEKYNVDCVFKSSEIKNKIKETNLELYGCGNVFQNEEIKQKIKQSNLEKYGVEFTSQVEIVKNKIKKTNLMKYGNECILNLDWVVNKSKKSYFDKYGVPLGTMTDDMRLKMSKTKKEKWIKDILKQNTNLKFLDIFPDKKLYSFECEYGHIFEISFALLNMRNRLNTIICTECNPIEKHISGLEIQLTNFIKESYNGVINENDKKIINPYEIDIYLPDLKLAFEFNGLFWHCEYSKSNTYHFDKTELCEKKEIKLVHIYEDDWLFKREIVKSRILNLIGKTKNKIYARKCEIKDVNDNELIRRFLNENHLQGFVGSQVKIGLFYKNELISLMTFGSKRKFMKQNNSDGVYEMLRFCNKLNTSVIGGADKLFKFFIKNYQPKEVISYADRSWSQGDLYKKLGFDFVCKTPPNYYYIIDKFYRKHRFGFRKDVLIEQGFDTTKSEHEIMLGRGLFRIYDSGSLKFVWKTNHL